MTAAVRARGTAAARGVDADGAAKLPGSKGRDVNVLVISPLVPASSGIASWTRRIVEHGLPGGCRVQVVDTGIYNEARARTVTVSDLKGRNLSWEAWAGEGSRSARILASLVRRLAVSRPHLVHLNCSMSSRGVARDLVCAAVARLRGVPVVGHYHGDVARFAGGRRGVSGRMLRKLVRLCALNVALNRDSLARLADLQHGAQRAPVLLPNFLPDTILRRGPDRSSARRGRVTVLYAGRVTAVKGCRAILAAARALPEADFVLLGQVMTDVEDDLRTLPANVTLGGEVAPDVVLQRMRSSDLFVFPTFHAEGLPCAVMEAMAAGLPVVASRGGVMPEMIAPGRGGLLVDGSDAAALVDALRTLIADPERRSRMGRFNRQRSREEYAWSVVAPRLVALYREVVDGAARPGSS